MKVLILIESKEFGDLLQFVSFHILSLSSNKHSDGTYLYIYWQVTPFVFVTLGSSDSDLIEQDYGLIIWLETLPESFSCLLQGAGH